MTQLSLTQSHLEKLCSVLLKRTILHLAGPDPYDQFRFVKNLPKRAHRLKVHQMHIAEKLIKQKEQLIQFYSDCCELVTRADTKSINEHDLKHFTSRLLALLDPRTHPERYIRIQCDALYAAISLATMNMSIYEDAVKQSMTQQIEKLERDARALDHPMALHHALRIAAMFFICTDQQLRAVVYMDENIKLTNEHRDLFTQKEWAEPQMMKAEALSYAGLYQEAYDIFEKLIPPGESRPNMRLSSQSRFFKVALTLGKYDVARKLLEVHFFDACEKEDSDVRIMSHLQIICYYMHMMRLDRADKHIAACRTLLHKHRQQQYLIQLLFFENAMLYLRGLEADAKLQAMKNLKFLRSRKMSRSNSTYPSLFASISAIYDRQHQEKPFNKRQQQDFETCTTKSYSHFAGIFQHMLDRRQAKASLPMSRAAARPV